MSSRRLFIQIMPLAGVSLLAACSDKAAPPAPAASPAPPPAPAPAAVAAAPAAAPPAAPAAGPVDPAEPAAVALGYVADSAKADKAKYPTHAAGQACGTCALFAGKAGDASGPCPLFAGRAVNVKGWCSGYTKKTT